MIALMVTGPDGRVSRILTGLSNPTAIAATAEENRKVMTGEAQTDASAPVDLKL